MNIQKDICASAIRKAALLITKAADIGMDLSGYGEAAENASNGNVYLWLEDYSFALYISPSGDDCINACWSDPENGDEEIVNTHNLTLHNLEQWAEELTEKAEEAA